METSWTVVLLIEWMMGGRDARDHLSIQMREEDMVWVAKKYECLDVLAWIEPHMYRTIIPQRQHRHVYIDIAAALGAWPLIGQAISDLEIYSGEPHCDHHKYFLDPRTWSPEDHKQYTRFGHIYIWGGTQSALEAHHPERGIDYRRMGQIFTDIMPKAE